MAYGYPTTRRFARSTMQAFQQDQGEWWYPPERTLTSRVWDWAAVVFFFSSILYLLGAK